MARPGRSEVLFLIPARGGSRRVPDKNVRTCAGRPLLAHAVIAAREAMRELDAPARLIVSTDSDEIARAAEEAGAEVPFRRPQEISGDEAPSEAAVLHALRWLHAEGGQPPATVVLLQATSPLVQAGDILGALNLFRRSRAPAVISVVEIEHWPHRAFVMEDDPEGSLQPVSGWSGSGGGRGVRANGAIWITNPASLQRSGTLVPEGTRGYVMPRERSLDIDTEVELEMADLLLRARAAAE